MKGYKNTTQAHAHKLAYYKETRKKKKTKNAWLKNKRASKQTGNQAAHDTQRRINDNGCQISQVA